MTHEDAWLCSVLPSSLSATYPQTCEPLELHKRLVHLASLREAALAQLGELDAVKVGLTEQKARQQAKQQAALDARLSAAFAGVDPHRSAAWDLIKALEKEAAYYSNVLQGLQASPAAEEWPALTARYQQLQQQLRQQQASVQPTELVKALSAELQPCSQVAEVQQVEQLRSQVDALSQQLLQAKAEQQSQAMVHQAAAPAEQLQQQQHCLQELAALQHLAALVTKQLELYSSMHTLPQQGVRCRHAVAMSAQHMQAATLLQQQKQRVLKGGVQHGTDGHSHSLRDQCMKLKHQLQQLSDVADAVMQLGPLHNSSAEEGAAAIPHSSNTAPAHSCSADETLASAGLVDPLERCCSPAVASAMQELREAMQGDNPGASSGLQAGQQLHSMDVRMRHALHPFSSGSSMHGLCGGGSSQGQDQMQLQVVRLRLAYQQMLHKVQARYQQDLRALSAKHQESLNAQVQKQQQALADLAKQHQEVCGRLAAAATSEADLQQQLARINADKQALQQQVSQLQCQVSDAAASALAVAQVQHEQQMLAAKQEQQQLVKDARQQVEQLQQQLQDLQQHVLQQQQPTAALPLAETVASLVAEAVAKQSTQQLEQLQQLEAGYKTALQQREQQHLSLLRDLAELKQLQDEPSNLSNASDNSSADGRAAQAQALQSAAGAAPASTKPTQQQQSSVAVEQCAADGSPHGPSHGCKGEVGTPGQDKQLQAQQQQQQQQQQQLEQEDEDAMNTLIAAVLGPTSRVKPQAAAAASQCTNQQPQATDKQWLAQSPSRRRQKATSADLQAELDTLLGLVQAPERLAAAARAQINSQQPAPHISNSSSRYADPDLAPANAALAAAIARSQVAETCLQALQDISCSTACNNAGGSPTQHTGGITAWRPGSPQKHAQQQWQQWQQHSGSTGAVTGNACSRTLLPAGQPAQQQQQQQPGGLPMLVCVRCGQQEGADIGPCCFHPGLVPAPGPLMYGQEWHTCRANCAPNTPGCYTRKEHFFAAAWDSPSKKGASTAAAEGMQRVDCSQVKAAAAAGVSRSPGRGRLAVGGRPSSVSPPRLRQKAVPATEPEPRRTLPKPCVWKCS